MKQAIFAIAIYAACFSGMYEGRAQSTDKFKKITVTRYWTDRNNQPLNFDAKVSLTLSSDEADKLGGDDKISADGITYDFNTPHSFPIRRDQNGRTFANYEVLVFADKDDFLKYSISLIDANGARLGLIRGTKDFEEFNRYSAGTGVNRTEKPNRILFKEWAIVLGLLLLSGLLLYFLISRWLFKVLLMKYKWPTAKAEHFTWSIVLLGLLAVATALTMAYLGPRFETWIVVGVVGAFWLLHAIVWAASGKEA
jgi:hypothetical protein